MGRTSRMAILVLAMMMVGCGGGADIGGAIDGGVVPTDDVPPPEGFGEPATDVPVISDRLFTTGSARVTAAGAFAFDEEVALNTLGSVAQDGMTYLLYGDAGSEEPNATITIQQDLGEIGIIVAVGQKTANASSTACSGEMAVTGDAISGHYSCPEAAAYDPATSEQSTVDMEIEFTADS